MCEGYVRDPDHPSHPETPLYKGFSDENVRDGPFFEHSVYFIAQQYEVESAAIY